MLRISALRRLLPIRPCGRYSIISTISSVDIQVNSVDKVVHNMEAWVGLEELVKAIRLEQAMEVMVAVSVVDIAIMEEVQVVGTKTMAITN